MNLPEISIVIQSFIFALFLVSTAFRMKGKYLAHVTTLLMAIVVMLSYFAWWGFNMAPIFGSYMQTLLSPSLHLVNWGAHEFLGISTLVSGAWIVSLWRRGSTEFEAKSERIWRITAILWVSAYLVGLLLFLTLNTNFL